MNVEVKLTVTVTDELDRQIASVSMTQQGDAGGNSIFLLPTVEATVAAAKDRAIAATREAVLVDTQTIRLLKLP